MPTSPGSADSPSGLDPNGDSSLSCLIASFLSSVGLSDAMPLAGGDDCHKGRQTPQFLATKNRTPVDRLQHVWPIGTLMIAARERDCKANARPAVADLSEACLPAARNDWG